MPRFSPDVVSSAIRLSNERLWGCYLNVQICRNVVESRKTRKSRHVGTLVRVPISTRRVQVFPLAIRGDRCIDDADRQSNFVVMGRLMRFINFGSAVANVKASHWSIFLASRGHLHDHFFSAPLEGANHAVFHLWLERHPRIEQNGRGRQGCPRVLLRA